MATIPSPTTYFDFRRVEMTDALWIDVQRLRYEVYCEEFGFLNAADYPTRLERDQFDAVSVHFAGIDATKQAIATFRLVHDSALGFPLERHAKSLFPRFHRLPREKTVEISRLILARRYRRRAADGRYGTGGIGAGEHGHATGQKRSPYPLVLFGLFRLMFEESVRRRVEWWLAAMEPWLQVFLSRFGFTFDPIGEPIEYYGRVVPYAARIEDIYQTVSSLKPDVLHVILGGSRTPSSA